MTCPRCLMPVSGFFVACSCPETPKPKGWVKPQFSSKPVKDAGPELWDAICEAGISVPWPHPLITTEPGGSTLDETSATRLRGGNSSA